MHSLRHNLIRVRERLQAAATRSERASGEITLIAVSKKHSPEAVRTLFDAGQRVFGESYLQEALNKQQDLADLAIEWHFIGPIQRNKTRAIATHFSWVHSVERQVIAERLNEQRPPELPALDVCLQVNIDQEPSKSGVAPQDLPALAEQVESMPRLRLRGLMAIPAPRESYAGQVEVFLRVRELLERLKSSGQYEHLDTLSMGMSADLEAAVAAGATMVRVGTDLFGAREM